MKEKELVNKFQLKSYNEAKIIVEETETSWKEITIHVMNNITIVTIHKVTL